MTASALGDVTFGTAGNNVKRTICLLAAATATNSPPTLVTQGVDAYETSADMYHKDPKAAFYVAEAPGYGQSVVSVISTAGSGTMTATITLWGYLDGPGLGKWTKLKALNGGSAIAETSADVIAYSEVVDGLGAFDRIYAEVAGIAGTLTAVEVYLTTVTKAGR